MPSHFQRPLDDRLVLGITGRIGAGKTSAGRYLSLKYGFQYLRYSQILSEWLAKDAETKAHLQEVGWEVMAGLLWVGAAQVDPGWVGNLFCPIYNLSNRPVVVRAGDPIALMDFVTTTSFKPDESKEYKRPPKQVLLREYNVTDLRSALYELADVKLGEFDRRIGGFQERIDSFISITFAVVGVVVAAVALSFGKPDQPRWWDPSILWVSALAIIVAMFSWVNSKSSVQWFKSSWQRMVFELLIFVSIITAVVTFSARTQNTVDTLTKQVRALQQQITNSPPIPAQSPQVPQSPLPVGPAQQAQPIGK